MGDTVLKLDTLRVCVTFTAVTVVMMAADSLLNLCIVWIIWDRRQSPIYFCISFHLILF